MSKPENGFMQIVSVQYAMVENISTIDYTDNYVSVNFQTGDWNEIESQLFSAMFEETSKEDIRGITYDQKLSFDIVGDNATVTSEFKQILGKELILKFTYQDGTSKVIGDIDNPCAVWKDYKSKQFESKHFYYCNREDYKCSYFLN